MRASNMANFLPQLPAPGISVPSAGLPLFAKLEAAADVRLRLRSAKRVSSAKPDVAEAELRRLKAEIHFEREFTREKLGRGGGELAPEESGPMAEGAAVELRLRNALSAEKMKSARLKARLARAEGKGADLNHGLEQQTDAISHERTRREIMEANVRGHELMRALKESGA
jgi:hypothetical protein